VKGGMSMDPHPSLVHSVVENNAIKFFTDYFLDKPGSIYTSFRVKLSDKAMFCPDFFILKDSRKVINNEILGVPDLVANIITHWTLFDARKNDFYACEELGVKEYWIIDPYSLSLEVYHHNGSIYNLFNVFSIWGDELLAQMTEKEIKEKVITEFKTSIFDDLVIKVGDIFKGVESYFIDSY
jgi:Uma2 family endonuclease